MNELNIQRNRTNYILRILYILSMAVAFESRHGYFGNLTSTIQIIIGLFWCACGFIKLFINHFDKKKYLVNETIYFLKLFLIPVILLHLYSIIPILVGNSTWKYFSSNLVTYVPCCLGVLSVYLFKDEAVKYSAIAMIIGYIISVMGSCVNEGFYLIIESIKEAYISEYYKTFRHNNILELHDIVLGVGYFVVYFFYANKSKITRRNLLLLLCIIIIMFLGVKRIAMLALVFIALISLFTKRMSEKNRYKIFKFGGVLIISLSYLFVYIISLIKYSDILGILSKLGIDPRGRLYYYEIGMRFADFSPWFLGIGRNALSEHLMKDFSYIRVTAVHSDILKVYIENGFIIFGWWLWYNAIKITKSLRDRYSLDIAIYYFFIYIYTYILNLTDNIDTYFVCRILPIQLIMSYAIFKDHKIFHRNLFINRAVMQR